MLDCKSSDAATPPAMRDRRSWNDATTRPARLRVVNNSSHTVHALWVTERGKEALYSSLAPGDVHMQSAPHALTTLTFLADFQSLASPGRNFQPELLVLALPVQSFPHASMCDDTHQQAHPTHHLCSCASVPASLNASPPEDRVPSLQARTPPMCGASARTTRRRARCFSSLWALTRRWSWYMTRRRGSYPESSAALCRWTSGRRRQSGVHTGSVVRHRGFPSWCVALVCIWLLRHKCLSRQKAQRAEMALAWCVGSRCIPHHGMCPSLPGHPPVHWVKGAHTGSGAPCTAEQHAPADASFATAGSV